MEKAEEELERRSKVLNSLIQEKKSTQQEEHHDRFNIRVRALDMPLALQNRAFKCARDNIDSIMPSKLDSKRLALALKKVFFTKFISIFLDGMFFFFVILFLQITYIKFLLSGPVFN